MKIEAGDREMIRTALVSVLALVGPAHLAAAEMITVCSSGCDYTSINAAIAAASDGDVIQLAAETYFEGEQIDTLGKAITLRGVLGKDGEPASVLDGTGTHRVLICENGEGSGTIFQDLIIRNGFVNDETRFLYGDSGAGMLNIQCSPSLENCDFENNSAIFMGGGIANFNGGNPTLRDCSFTANSGMWGGGVCCLDDASVTMTNCAFTNNSAFDGGGLYNAGNSSTLTDCTFLGNVASGGGGGMFNDTSEGTMVSCLFMSNTATYGGGMYNRLNNPTIVDCVFAQNSAVHGGGAYFFFGASNLPPEASLQGSEFASNAAGVGAGVLVSSSSKTMPSLSLSGCTFQECCQVYPPRSIIDLGGNDYDSWCDDCRANIDCRNDAVDAEDLGYLLARWGTDDPQSDIDGDGLVTASDLGFLFAAWGPCQ